MGTFDGNWESKIGNTDDGIISIEPPVLTFVLGTHRDTNSLVMGNATDGDVPHLIIGRRYNGCTIIYEGDIKFVEAGPNTGDAHYEVYNGTSTKVCRTIVDGKTTAQVASDDWTAEKPT